MQLDLLLTSIYKNFKDFNLPIYIINDFEKSHKRSYYLIKKKWKNKIKIININTKKTSFFKKITKYHNYFFRINNIIHNLRWRFFGFSDFKIAFEEILLKKVKTDFVTMMTDDTMVFKKNVINKFVYKKIKNNPKDIFYRYCIDKNFTGEEKVKNAYNLKTLKINNKKFYTWDCRNNIFLKYNYFWNYRFAIDASIFYKSELLKFLKPIYYSNPSNLESIGNKEAYLRGYYMKGMSDLKRTYAGIHLNNIQTQVDTPAASFDPEFLKYLFMENYKIVIDNKLFNNKFHNIVPDDIIFSKKDKKFKYSFLLNKFKK